MSMTKIGVLSDTHGLLRPEVFEELKGCRAIFHGGDINRQEILDQLEKIAPVVAVRGNNDKDWAEKIPYVAESDVDGLRICMAHKKSDLPPDLSGYGLVICGHTHRYEERHLQSGILLNPGSCGPRRFHQEITMAVVSVEGGIVNEIRKVLIPHKAAHVRRGGGDLRTEIEGIVRDVQRGRSVEEIAASRNTDQDFVEQVCRLYLTHPGVDTEGIMKKMGI